MKLKVLIITSIFFLFLAGCAQINPKPVGTSNDTNTHRLAVIYEHEQTKNTGGFTVIRDNKTGIEYLVVTGLNGSCVVIPLESPPANEAGR